MQLPDHVSSRLRLLACAAGLVLAASLPLEAADGTWATGAGNWVDGGNWTGGVIPGGVGTTNSTDKATFGSGGSGGTITVDATRNVDNITYDTNAYTLTGGSLVLTSNADTATNTTSIVGTTGSLAIQSNIVLQGDANFSGGGNGIGISGGVSGTAITDGVFSLTLGGASALNKISGSISDGVSGGKVALIINQGTTNHGTWELSAANTFSGGITFSPGWGATLLVSHSEALGTGNILMNSSNSGSDPKSGILAFTGGVNVTSVATMNFNSSRPSSPQIDNFGGNNSFSADLMTLGPDLRLSSTSGKLTLSGDININNGSGGGTTRKVLYLGGEGTGEITGRIYRAGTATPMGITKTGGGTWILSNPGVGSGNRNDYAAPTLIQAGTFLVNTDNTEADGLLTVSAGATYGGNGISGGITNFEAGSFLSPGAGAGLTATKTFTKNLDISGLATGTGGLIFQLGSSSDQVALSNGTAILTLTGLELNDFNFTFGSGFGAGTYTLFDTQASIAGGLGAGLVGIQDGYELTLSLANAGQDLVVTAVAVPEPMPALGLALGGLGLLALRRRRAR